MNIRKIAYGILNLFPRLRGFLVAIKDHKNSVIPSQTSALGFKFAGPSSMIDGTFEKEETPLIQRLIEQNEIFINIGANVGYYCCLAAKAAKPLIAFEPHSVNARILLRNLDINGFSKNVEIYPTAVGAENGILKLFGSGTAASLVDGWAGISSESFTLVSVVTLDGVLAGRLEGQSIFILIDVEGAEYSVLKGSMETLQRQQKPWWVIEICIADHQPTGITINPNLLPTYDLIVGAGYEVWTLSNHPQKVLREDLEKINETKIDSLGIHNFLCIEPLHSLDAINLLKQLI